MTHSKQQRGGTLLGLVIGLVAGLGLALAVAVYVTKVPVPFLNKGQTRNADQDAAETKKNKDWDPNAPLAGKPAAKPAAAASAAAGKITPDPSAADAKVPVAAETKPEAKTAAKTEIKPDAKPDSKPDTKPELKTDTKAASNDPLGDLAKAKSSTTGIDPFIYFIQAGAYRTSEDAETQRAKLSLGGIEAKVTEREQAGRPIFRVRVGPFEKKDEADKTKERLDASGLDTALVRVQR